MKRLTGLIAALAMAMGSVAMAEPAQLEVGMRDYRFEPDQLQLVVGRKTALTLTNHDRFTPHNFILEAPEAGMDLDVDVPPGETVTIQFVPGKAGFYPFYCNKRLLFFKSHRERGMHGILVVSPAAGP